MRLEPVLLSYAGLAAAALTNWRVRRELGLSTLPPVWAAWAMAAALLLLSAWRAVHHFGAYQGPVAFVGALCLAGVPLVLILSRWPRAGIGAALPGIAVALGLSLLVG